MACLSCTLRKQASNGLPYLHSMCIEQAYQTKFNMTVVREKLYFMKSDCSPLASKIGYTVPSCMLHVFVAIESVSSNETAPSALRVPLVENDMFMSVIDNIVEFRDELNKALRVMRVFTIIPNIW